MMKATTLLLLGILAAARTAKADNPLEVHAAGGLELTGGDHAFAAGFRGHAAVGKAFGGGAVRPAASLGVVFGAGSVYVDDPRALDGALDIHVRTYGPEAQVALKFVDGGRVDSRIFASASILQIGLDRRLRFDRVPGVSGSSAVGFRGSLGANWADRILRSDRAETNLILVFVPQQAELVYERDAGSNRYGAMFGWGI